MEVLVASVLVGVALYFLLGYWFSNTWFLVVFGTCLIVLFTLGAVWSAWKYYTRPNPSQNDEDDW